MNAGQSGTFKKRTRTANNTCPWMTDCLLLEDGAAMERHRAGSASHIPERVSFNRVVKEARTVYFANLISSWQRNPKM